MVDYIADYLENIRDRHVFPSVQPGYMRNLIPETAPGEGEEWSEIVKDIERVIMPGITHWQSPHMHAYFPALNSFPSLLGDMLADAINCLGFTWVRTTYVFCIASKECNKKSNFNLQNPLSLPFWLARRHHRQLAQNWKQLQWTGLGKW